MTRDEVVMAMTDDALWWKALRCLHGDNVLGGYSVHKESGRAWTQIDGEKVWRADCDYPNDIAAAWELWKKLPTNRQMSENSMWIEIACGPTLDRIDDTFLRISRRDEFDYPRAITRAFILAMEAT